MKSFVIKTLICVPLLHLTITSKVLGNINCHSEKNYDTVNECSIILPSNALHFDSVYIKSWIPKEIKPSTPTIIFFHGRGYATAPNSTAPTMIEAAGLNDWMQTEEFKSNPAIILSPQDLFVRQDGTGVGNDYWIGADGRNWEDFVVKELKPYVESELMLEDKPWLTAGISMGAHAAMKMSLDHPEEFKGFVSLSPVFRSSNEEIHGADRDVFFQFEDLATTSIGARLLNDEKTWQTLNRVPHWIEIHEKDFALGNGFTDSKRIWDQLSNTSWHQSNLVNPINHDLFKEPGHSMEFWKSRIPEALSWLLSL